MSKSIDTPHSDYTRFKNRWARLRDTFAGPDDVKDAGQTYLPGMKGKPELYDAYRTRADFIEATSRTVFSLMGQVLRKPWHLKTPPAMEGWLPSIGAGKEPFSKIAVEILRETLLMGRVVQVVDYPEGTDVTDPPRVAIYRTEDVVNWDDAKPPQWVVLKESYRAMGPSGMPWDFEDKPQYRAIWIEDGDCLQQLFRRKLDQDGGTSDKGEFIPVGDPIPIRPRGMKLDSLPVIGIGPLGLGLSPSKSVIQAVADLNLSLYRTSADLEWGRHFTGLPTPWMTGYKDPKNEIVLGSTAFLQIPSREARLGMLEFTGEGLSSLDKAVDQKQNQLAAMGARLLVAPKREAETAEALRMASGAESASLANVVDSSSDGIEQMLQLIAKWEGLNPDQVEFSFNRDFIETQISPDMIRAMSESVLVRLLPKKAFWHSMRQGEVLPEDWDDETLAAMIAEEVPIGEDDGRDHLQPTTEGAE